MHITLHDLLKNLISGFYDRELKLKGSVGREFYEKDELKENCYKAISYNPSFESVSPNDFDGKFNLAVKEVKLLRQTTIGESVCITKIEKESWLDKNRINILGWDDQDKPTYRNRYLKYLNRKGRPLDVIEETKNSSLEIVKKIGDPNSNAPFFVKGLVVGSVQSGKTSNFNAVINSCIDLGYNLVIVLSGIMEDLRRQTQLRIEKEVEGKMVSINKFSGVGDIASFGIQGKYKDVTPITIITSELKDFSKDLLDSKFSLDHKNLLICKKNTSVLKNLILWLNEYLVENGEKHNIPLIIIDDEADNASLNNLGHKGANYANKINGHIRTLLAMFNKKTYLGYTATPFANILQDWNNVPDEKWKVFDSENKRDLLLDQVGNLFPDDFIELLNTPSNYVGPKNFFETKIEDVPKLEPLLSEPLTDHLVEFPDRVELLEDGTLLGVKKYNSKNEFDEDFFQTRFDSFSDYKARTRAVTKYDVFPKKLPGSLEEAVYCFILSVAIRLSRKSEIKNSPMYQPHNTMLVHISRFTEWQTRTKDLIIDLLDSINIRLKNHKLVEKGSIYFEFERIWIKYFSEAMNNIDDYLTYKDEFLTKKNFLEVREHLVTAVTGIEIMAVNTLSNDELNYEKGEKKYIVIGGNKLSRGFTLEGLTINYFVRNTNYSDTLLQMGRWFGYRIGYIDCCKLFTTFETLEKFNQCTWTIEELESEFVKLSKSIPHKTPKEYATKVLTHPGTLKITRPSILKNAVLEKWSYEDKLIQTTSFILTKDKIESSWLNFKNWISNLNFQEENLKGFVKLKTTPEVVFSLIKTQEVYPNDSFDALAIERYIKLANKFNKLTEWTIAIKLTGESRKFSKEDSGLKFDLQLKTISTNKNYIKVFKDTKIFKAYGQSLNIITSGKDLSVSLPESEIEKAQIEFKREKPGAKSYPERIYRERIPDTQGVLIVYLMDLEKIFTEDNELKEIAKKEAIPINSTPLIGFAIGIPPIGPNVSGDYLLNKHILANIQNSPIEEEIIEEESEFEDELSVLYDLKEN